MLVHLPLAQHLFDNARRRMITTIITMDELVQKPIRQSEALEKPSQLIQWRSDGPWPQSHYSWDLEGEGWQPITPLHATSPAKDEARSSDITTRALYSWNIDLMSPFAEARMDAVLAHLEELTNHSAVREKVRLLK